MPSSPPQSLFGVLGSTNTQISQGFSIGYGKYDHDTFYVKIVMAINILNIMTNVTILSFYLL